MKASDGRKIFCWISLLWKHILCDFRFPFFFYNSLCKTPCKTPSFMQISRIWWSKDTMFVKNVSLLHAITKLFIVRSHSNSLYCMTMPGNVNCADLCSLSITKKKKHYIISAIKWGQGNIGFCSHEKHEEDCEARYVVNKRPICLDGNLSTLIHKWKAFYVHFRV